MDRVVNAVAKWQEECLAAFHDEKKVEPIIQVLDFVNELYSSKFQVPNPGALLVQGAGALTLTSRESSHKNLIGVDTQEPIVEFKVQTQVLRLQVILPAVNLQRTVNCGETPTTKAHNFRLHSNN